MKSTVKLCFIILPGIHTDWTAQRVVFEEAGEYVGLKMKFFLSNILLCYITFSKSQKTLIEIY